MNINPDDVIRLDYDEEAFDIIDTLNTYLKDYGLEIEWIEGERDGYEEFYIKEIKEE